LGGGICIQGTFDVQIDNNDISNNDAIVGDGISLWEGGLAEGASAWIINNRIANNQSDGIYISDNCSALIGGNRDNANDIFGNIEYNVRNNSTNEIDATYNYWGTTVLYGNHGMLQGDAEIVPLYGTWPPPKRGDVSGNGQITAYDAALILQYVVGLINIFPADSMGSPSAIEAQDYDISLPNVETHACEKIQVPIAINDATGLLAGGVTVKYDSTVLRAIGYGSLELLNGYYWKANTDLTGEVRFAFATTEVVTTMGQGNLLMVEFEVLPNAEGKTSPLILENVNLSNSRSIMNINGEVRVIPSIFALLQNFPNPFNPDTWLPYKLASASPVNISIYNVKGQLIRKLNLGYQNAGVYVTKGKAAYWDGKDNLGERVSSGMYFYTLQAREFRSIRKMVIVK